MSPHRHRRFSAPAVRQLRRPRGPTDTPFGAPPTALGSIDLLGQDRSTHDRSRTYASRSGTPSTVSEHRALSRRSLRLFRASHESLRVRLSHPFAFVPPSFASARRCFARARSRAYGSPCGSPSLRDARCVRTGSCHPSLHYEHPRLVGSSARVAPALSSVRAGLGNERFTTLTPLRRILGACSCVGGVFFPVVGFSPTPRAREPSL